jgi:hypothetical protein
MGVLKRLVQRAEGFLLQLLLPPGATSPYPDAASQLQLQMTYRALADSGNALPDLGQVGFKVSSQTDEDGILLYIFAIIGTTNKLSVEICAGNGIECNTANLIVHRGWHGLLVDGNKNRIRLGRAFYRHNPSTSVCPPVLVQAWVTRDNVNDLISRNGFGGEIDLLSIDMDGMDYWIWQAIHVVRPRVVVVEYQDIIGPDRALTVPYSDDFNAYEYPTTRGSPNFCGASLPAFVKLAREQGYRLVGCNRLGYNAFFIRNPIGERELPEIDVRECFKHPRVLRDMRERFPTVQDLPWVEV